MKYVKPQSPIVKRLEHTVEKSLRNNGYKEAAIDEKLVHDVSLDALNYILEELDSEKNYKSAEAHFSESVFKFWEEEETEKRVSMRLRSTIKHFIESLAR